MRKHCTMSELLAIRDGEGSAWARDHLTACPFCRQELDLVHARVAALRALPSVRPPRDRWAVVRAGAEAARRRGRWRRAGWGAVAIAASAVLMIGVRSAQHAGEPVAATPELAQLMDRSRDLEAALQAYGTEGRVLNAGAAGIIADLEDQIAVVDAGISQAGTANRRSNELVGLWRNRVQLMDALVSAHVTRAKYVGF